MSRRGFSLGAGVNLIALMTLVAPVTGSAARAEPAPPSPANAALAVYVETIPTGSGSRAVGLGAEGTTRLPAATRKRLTRAGGADAKLLEQVATAASYGAPQQPQQQRQQRTKSPPTTSSRKAVPGKQPPRSKRPSAPTLPAVPEPAFESPDLLRWWLLAGAMALSGIAAAIRRPSRPRASL